MQRLNNYSKFLILEKYDDHIRKELVSLGITDEKELRKMISLSKRGSLAKYLSNKGSAFTIGMLMAIFQDAHEAKTHTDLKIGLIKMAHRIIPMAMAPFYPILAIIGYTLGTSRAFNKIIAPILANPGNNFPEFLKKVISSTMSVAEGEFPIKDRFSRAFVLKDGLMDIVKPVILHEFTLYLADKMSKMDPNTTVPDFYIDNQLRNYLNTKYDIDPGLPII